MTYRDYDVSVHDLTSDDLIRLVVGMQWVTGLLLSEVDNVGPDIDFCSDPMIKPASTIVDEWLGVR